MINLHGWSHNVCNAQHNILKTMQFSAEWLMEHHLMKNEVPDQERFYSMLTPPSKFDAFLANGYLLIDNEVHATYELECLEVRSSTM